MGGARYLDDNQEINSIDEINLNPKISAALHTYLESHFPQLQGRISVEMEWIGIMGWTPDYHPLVGELPRGWDAGNGIIIGREYILAGYSGHGMPICFLCGRSIAQMITGVPVSDVLPKLYEPSLQRLSKPLNLEDFNLIV